MSRALRVVVVDDSELIRAVVAAALGGRGASVVEVASPREIASAVDGGADVVLLDAGFPDVTAEELRDIARRESGRAPVVVFSDRPAAELSRLAEDWGARGAIGKGAVGVLWEELERLLGPSQGGRVA